MYTLPVVTAGCAEQRTDTAVNRPAPVFLVDPFLQICWSITGRSPIDREYLSCQLKNYITIVIVSTEQQNHTQSIHEGDDGTPQWFPILIRSVTMASISSVTWSTIIGAIDPARYNDTLYTGGGKDGTGRHLAAANVYLFLTVHSKNPTDEQAAGHV